jgi:hypothetical protein
MTEHRRVETIQIKLTPAEKETIQESAGSQPVSTYIREMLLPKHQTDQREAKTETAPNKGTPSPKKSVESSRPRPKPNFRQI